jgi:hypothetical protein
VKIEMGFLKKFIDAAENSIEKGINLGKEGMRKVLN